MNDIIIKDLCKSFGEKKVLEGFSATFPAGSASCIMAPSGAGKTTLLSIMQGFTAPDSGSITGNDVKMSAVFQEDRLCEDFGAVSNVRFSCGSGKNKKSKEEIVACLESLGLGDSLDKPVREFSGGMKRRVAIARALINLPQIVFADEPTGNLDRANADEVLELLLRTKELLTQTLIIVTHDMKIAERADRIMKMDNGRLTPLRVNY